MQQSGLGMSVKSSIGDEGSVARGHPQLSATPDNRRMQTRARRPGVRGAAAALLAAITAVACSPVFDWREARPDGSGVALMFPCRPAMEDRQTQIGAAPAPIRVHSCATGGAVFALAAIDAADPAGVTPMLDAFRLQTAANLAGTATELGAFSPPGATPNPRSARLAIVGKRPDGRHVVAQAAFFVKGLKMFQATVLNADIAGGPQAADTFFGAIRLL